MHGTVIGRYESDEVKPCLPHNASINSSCISHGSLQRFLVHTRILPGGYAHHSPLRSAKLHRRTLLFDKFSGNKSVIRHYNTHLVKTCSKLANVNAALIGNISCAGSVLLLY